MNDPIAIFKHAGLCVELYASGDGPVKEWEYIFSADPAGLYDLWCQLTPERGQIVRNTYNTSEEEAIALTKQEVETKALETLTSLRARRQADAIEIERISDALTELSLSRRNALNEEIRARKEAA